MKQQLLNDLQELDFENMDMYFFYIKDLVESNENIGDEVINQIQSFIASKNITKIYGLE